MVIINDELTADDVAGQRVLCPGCGKKVFESWPEGWDAHAGYRCNMPGATIEDRKLTFKNQFGHLFKKKGPGTPRNRSVASATGSGFQTELMPLAASQDHAPAPQPERRWLGIDFSGNRHMWAPGCTRSNVWVADVVHDDAGCLQLHSLMRVQQVEEDASPFQKLATLLKRGAFKGAGIDAPFSLPAGVLPAVGADPADYRVVIVKSAQHFYNGFVGVAKEILYVASPGAANPDYANLPYTKRKTPYWPKVADPWK